VEEGDPPLLSLCKNVSLWGAACDTGAVVEGVGASDVTGVSP